MWTHNINLFAQQLKLKLYNGFQETEDHMTKQTNRHSEAQKM